MPRKRCPAGQVWSESEGRCVKQLPRSSHSGNPRSKDEIFKQLNTLIDEANRSFERGDFVSANALTGGAREVYFILTIDERSQWKKRNPTFNKLLDELLVKTGITGEVPSPICKGSHSGNIEGW